MILLLTIFHLLLASAHDKLTPYWPNFPSREVILLDGIWDFHFEKEYDLNDWSCSLVSFKLNATVPGNFDVTKPGKVGLVGTAFYKTTFTTRSYFLTLIFSACSWYCRVWVDGHLIGDNRAGGYSQFSFELPVSDNDKREIVVLVNNEVNPKWSPMYTPYKESVSDIIYHADFYHYSGINRNVMILGRNHSNSVIRVEVLPVSLTKIEVSVYLNTSQSDVLISGKIINQDGDSFYFGPMKIIISNNHKATFSLDDSTMKSWTPQRPHLQLIHISYENDIIETRFGMRLLGIDNGRVTLNGEKVKLLGVNRHTMRPDTGNALTFEQVKADVELLKALNVNYVRGAHYPQDQRFLELCDETGIMVWEETLGPGVHRQQLKDDYFMNYQIEQVHQMVSTSFNHPSVIMWGFFNEADDLDYDLCCPGYSLVSSTIRSRDPSRLITWASNHRENGTCYEFADVISFNDYPGWYTDIGDIDAIKSELSKAVEWARSNFPEKAVTISECGAGAIWEWDNATAVRWSQRYQSEVVDAEITFAMENDYLSGIALWQFSDIKADRMDTLKCGACDYESDGKTCAHIDVNCKRPGGENHKGLLDFWRRPKRSFSSISEILHRRVH